MSRNSFKSIVLYATAGIGLLLMLVGLLFAVEQSRTQAETSAVLSAFFSQVVLHDMDKWNVGRTITIVVLRNPHCPFCAEPPIGLESQSWFAQSLKSRVSSVRGPWFAQSSRMTRASFVLNNVLSRDFGADLRLASGVQTVFVNPSDLPTKLVDFETRFPNNMGYFVVSHVGLNLNKTEALLYVERFCRGLCGGGEYVLLRKVNGVWHIIDHRDTWVS